MATYDEMFKSSQDAFANMQNSGVANNTAMVGPSDAEWNQYLVNHGLSTPKTTDTTNHYMSGMNFYYSIGIVIFILIFIAKDFKTALRVTLYWFGFWSLLYFIYSSGKIGESVVMFGYAFFVFGGFILYVLKK